MRPGDHWPALRISDCLEAQGFGLVERMLKRVVPLPSSSRAGRGNRATYTEKFNSLRARRTIVSPAKITVVDDQISKGSEVFAAATRLREEYPNAEIHAFGMALTLGFVKDVPALAVPFRGKITRLSVYTVEREDPSWTRDPEWALDV